MFAFEFFSPDFVNNETQRTARLYSAVKNKILLSAAKEMKLHMIKSGKCTPRSNMLYTYKSKIHSCTLSGDYYSLRKVRPGERKEVEQVAKKGRQKKQDPMSHPSVW